MATPGRPEGASILDGQVGGLVREAGADPRIGVMLVALPTPEQRAERSDNAGAVDLEIPVKGAQQKRGFVAGFDVPMAEVESQLSVNVRRRQFRVVTEGASAAWSANNGVPGMGV